MQEVVGSDFFSRQGWYPSTRTGCVSTIETCIAEPFMTDEEAGGLVGGVVPHAGWMFSGELACHVFQTLAQGGGVDRVVVFGSHMAPKSRAWILGDGVWKTPLGGIEGDPEFAKALAESVPGLKPSLLGHDGYEPDNTIELQMPLLKHFLPDARFVVAGVPASPEGVEMGAKAAELAKERGGRTVVVGSTDLTHYGFNYGFTPVGTGEEAVHWVKNENDRKSVDAVERMDAEGLLEEGLKRHNACCPGAASAALAAGRAMGAKKARILAYRTSYDIRPSSSFVGYVAAVF